MVANPVAKFDLEMAKNHFFTGLKIIDQGQSQLSATEFVESNGESREYIFTVPDGVGYIAMFPTPQWAEVLRRGQKTDAEPREETAMLNYDEDNPFRVIKIGAALTDRAMSLSFESSNSPGLRRLFLPSLREVVHYSLHPRLFSPVEVDPRFKA